MPTFPIPKHPDGRKAQISDGFHDAAQVAAKKATRLHRGADLMYRKKTASAPTHPYSSKWYEIPKPVELGGVDVPFCAPETCLVRAAGYLSTGFWVALDIGEGRGVACHHLRKLFVGPFAGVTDGRKIGAANARQLAGLLSKDEAFVVGEGTPLGLVGGSPVGYGLYHAHTDLAEGCKWDLDKMASWVTSGAGVRLDGKFVDPAKYLASCKHVTLDEAWGDHGRVGANEVEGVTV